MNTLAALPGWRIWVARYSGNDWEKRAFHVGVQAHEMVEGSPIPAFGPANTQATMIGAGKMLAVTMSSSLEPLVAEKSRAVNPKMALIHPCGTPPPDLTASGVMDDAEAESLRARLASFFK